MLLAFTYKLPCFTCCVYINCMINKKLILVTIILSIREVLRYLFIYLNLTVTYKPEKISLEYTFKARAPYPPKYK